MKKALALLLSALLLLSAPCFPAQAGTAGALPSQSGEYAPFYSPSCTLTVAPGQPFRFTLYQDSGTRTFQAVRNGGVIPPGAELQESITSGSANRTVYLKGTVLTEGSYSFGVMIREEDGDGHRMLALLQVTLRITADAPAVDRYLGDGQGMLRLIKPGVNFRRTPGGTRLGTYDEGTRLVWCRTETKGGYTWYRVWTQEHGYGYIRGDVVLEEEPQRIIYTPGEAAEHMLFITPGTDMCLTPSLIMTEAPDVIGFDASPFTTLARGGDTWTLLRLCIPDERAFWILVDLRDELGAPLECKPVYFTTLDEEPPVYINN